MKKQMHIECDSVGEAIYFLQWLHADINDRTVRIAVEVQPEEDIDTLMEETVRILSGKNRRLS